MIFKRPKLCRNKKTGAIFIWNEFLKNDPDIELLTEKQIQAMFSKKGKKEPKSDDILDKK